MLSFFLLHKFKCFGSNQDFKIDKCCFKYVCFKNACECFKIRVDKQEVMPYAQN